MEDLRPLNASEESKFRKLIEILNLNTFRLDLSALSDLRNIFNTEAIDVLDYPHAISMFIVAYNKKFDLDEYFPMQEVAMNQSVSELYCNINYKRIARNTFEEYLAYIIEISARPLLADISPNYSDAIPSRFEEFQQRLHLFSLPYSDIKQNYSEIIHEELFCEALCYVAIKIHSKTFLSYLSMQPLGLFKT